MGKKKKKKVHGHAKGPSSRKIHEPTAFELAYREAETKTPVKPDEKKETLPQPSATAPSKKKRDYLLGASTTQITKEQYSLSEETPSITGDKPLVKLGLKAVAKKTVVLDVGSLKDEQWSHDPEKSGMVEGVSGRSQVNDGTAKDKDESDIVVGFDFGTSSSKVVIRDSGRQTADAVPFGPLACPGNSYLIPTRIFISDDGEFSLSPEKHPYSDLKIHLIDNSEQEVFTATNTLQSITVSELATAYLAMVIRYARSWFLQYKASIYKKTDIQWQINMGMPSKNYDNQSIRKTFQVITMAAWRISRIDATISIAEVKRILEEARNHTNTKEKNAESNRKESLWLHPDFVNTHPEVIMEVVGYTKSPSRTSGLHLLIDVGATTLDLATFVVHSNKDGEDLYPLLETNVTQHGTMVLHQRRVETLINHLQEKLRQLKYINPTHPLPSLTHYEIIADKNTLLTSDNKFFDECSEMIGIVIKDTRDHRHPLSSVWKSELPVFICGGGGRVSAYREMIINRGLDIARGLKEFDGFTLKELPKPDELDLSPQEYDRLAVAYGLSFTTEEIGEVIMESKVRDIHKEDKIRNVEDLFVSKDKC